ncbi:hypothetical protein ACW18Q_02325 [Limosilactobacillus reuteri]
MATGLADDAVSTTLLATSAPKIVVPAMNSRGWHPQLNETLLDLNKTGSILCHQLVED